MSKRMPMCRDRWQPGWHKEMQESIAGSRLPFGRSGSTVERLKHVLQDAARHVRTVVFPFNVCSVELPTQI